eukprot:TRINITY_DN2473_c0_g1_i1.p2 TRINITY_DN2473_c0_g1~~TRINITY_DN2473_c0_g1_i1.p2  ORF type:complete len:448 (+),score=148.41 TRINITY_DN2473_c0_g1_i1:99-1442(+)
MALVGSVRCMRVAPRGASSCIASSRRQKSQKPKEGDYDPLGGRNPDDPLHKSTYMRNVKSAIPDDYLNFDKKKSGSTPANDPNAPGTSAERKEWIASQMKGWKAPQKNDTFEDHVKRANLTHVNFFGESDMTAREMEEEKWLAKRQRELNKQGHRVLVGSGVLMAAYLLYIVYKNLTRTPNEHPAKNVYVGELVELKLSVGGTPLPQPVVIGLFTQRAPKASENFHRLVTGENDKGLSLKDLEFFRVERHALYGGVLPGQDARGGVVVVPDAPPGRLPQEDSELPPFKYALTACKRSFYSNGGFDSTFAILSTDNPPSLGHKSYATEHARVSELRSRGQLFGSLTGEKVVVPRMEFYPPSDGAYVFGTVVQGTETFDLLMDMVRSKPPHFVPNPGVRVEECTVLSTNLPGRREKAVVREEEDELKQELLRRIDRSTHARQLIDDESD